MKERLDIGANYGSVLATAGLLQFRFLNNVIFGRKHTCKLQSSISPLNRVSLTNPNVPEVCFIYTNNGLDSVLNFSQDHLIRTSIYSKIQHSNLNQNICTTHKHTQMYIIYTHIHALLTKKLGMFSFRGNAL